jgi:hypothetical protein
MQIFIYFPFALLSFKALAWLTYCLGALCSFNHKAYWLLVMALCSPSSHIITSFTGPMFTLVAYVHASKPIAY